MTSLTKPGADARVAAEACATVRARSTLPYVRPATTKPHGVPSESVHD
jgi:hypothetical protein